MKVWDKGIGIAPENQARLFKPFVQLDGSLSRAYTGTGLGLSLVHRMAELHGGKVRVESALGEGSTFTICLPWSDNANQPPGALTQAISTSPANQGMAVREHAQEPLVLIADDNNITLEIVSDYLNDKGYRVVVTTHMAWNSLTARPKYLRISFWWIFRCPVWMGWKPSASFVPAAARMRRVSRLSP